MCVSAAAAAATAAASIGTVSIAAAVSIATIAASRGLRDHQLVKHGKDYAASMEVVNAREIVCFTNNDGNNFFSASDDGDHERGTAAAAVQKHPGQELAAARDGITIQGFSFLFFLSKSGHLFTVAHRCSPLDVFFIFIFFI